MTEFMRSSDAFTWAMESDPRLRSTVVTVLLLEKSPNWDDVRDRIDLISRKLPMFRQRVVESPPPAPPRWESDPDFDLDFHIREMAAPEPGNLGGVLEIARVSEMEDFDRARPLWTVTLIDGLEDGGAAMLCKFHHSLTDGVGGVQIGMTLFDLSELSGEHDPLPAPPKVPRPPWLSGYRDVFGYDAGLVASAMAGAITSAPKLIYNSVRRPVATVESATATAASIYRTVRPVNRTGSVLMKNRTLTRRLGVHQVPMPQLRDAAHRCGGALNDGFVAGLAGGLRLNHERHGVSVATCTCRCRSV
jgi:diacylglycerol O-acyltransferase / wax synthase